MNTIVDTLNYIVNTIVPAEYPVTINKQEIDGITSLEISAPPEIIGQIVGKQGKIIKSIRQILNLSYPNQRYTLEIKG